MLQWNSLERVASFAGSCVSLISVPVPVLATGGALAIGSLLKIVSEERKRRGPQCETEFAKIRESVLAELKNDIIFGQRTQADLNSADEALERDLPACTLDREKIARAAVSRDGFPAAIANLVLQELARIEPVFSETPEHETSRAFAKKVISGALAAALDNDDYFKSLQPYLLKEIAAGVGRVEEKIGDLDTKLAEVLELIRAKQLADPAALKTPELALLRAAERFGELKPNASKDDVFAHLEYFATEYHRISDALEHLTARDNRVHAARQAAKEALDSGNIAKAREHLAEAVAAFRERTEENLAETTSALDALARADLLALDWQTANMHWQQAAAYTDPFSPKDALAMRSNAAEALLEFGERYGLTGPVEAASEIYETLIATSTARGWQAVAAEANLHHGVCLFRLGEHRTDDAGKALLERSVQTLNETLKPFTKEQNPRLWANAHYAQAIARLGLAPRQPGADGKSHIDHAIPSFLAAAEVITEKDTPLLWAELQSNLAIGYQLLVGYAPAAEIPNLLSDAEECYRKALRILTKEADRAKWAGTIANMGNLYQLQAKSLPEPVASDALQKSIAAFKDAVTAIDKTGEPLKWGMLNRNLAKSLYDLAYRSTGQNVVAFLHEAVAALDSAIDGFTQTDYDDLSLEAMERQSEVLLDLSDLTEGKERHAALSQAFARMSAVTRFRKRETSPDAWANAKCIFATVLSRAAEELSNSETFRVATDAEAAFREALPLYDRETAPDAWAKLQHELGIVLFLEGVYGEPQDIRPRIENAIAALKEAANIRTPSKNQANWVDTENRLLQALVVLGKCETGDAARSALAEAADVARGLCAHFDRTNRVLDSANQKFNLARILLMQSDVSTRGERKLLLGEAETAALAMISALKERGMAEPPPMVSDLLAAIRENLAANGA